MPTISLLGAPDARLTSGLPQVEPVLIVPRTDPFDDPGWVFEPRYEGFRGFVYASKGSCEIRCRQNFGPERFRDLCDRISEVLGRREVIVDGEVVALNRQGKPVFRDLLRNQGFITFAAFDLLWLDGTDLRPLPLRERKRLLAELLPEDTGPLYKILTLDEHGRALFGAVKKMDVEGIVAKRKEDCYGADTIWYEIKNPGYSQGERRLDPFRRRERRRLER
jgi:bifunctional non-homologous end joining protein LigD